MRHASASFVLLVLGAGPALASAPSLPFSYDSESEGYVIRFTDQGSHALPLSQAIDAADALDRDGLGSVGNPKGYHDGYVSLGFQEPWFSGEKDVDFWNCKDDPDTDCDNGQAIASRIRMPTSLYSVLQNPGGNMSTESCMREVLGHELFHHVEFGYVQDGGGSGCGPWPAAACEGFARMMQDQIYDDIDTSSTVCISAQGEFNQYLEDPNRTLWDLSYTASLFWKYAAEQYGAIDDEPTRGSDFVRLWWENAVDDVDTPDIVQLTRSTIQDLGGAGVNAAFHDFAIANVAKDFDVSPLSASEEARWSYVDSGQGFGQPAYAEVPIARNQSVSIGDGDAFGGFVADWGAFYLGFDTDQCPNLAHLNFSMHVPGVVPATAMMALLFVRDGAVVDVVEKSSTAWDYSRLVPVQPYDRAIFAIAARDDPLAYEISADCIANPPDVDFPVTARPHPTHGGPPGSFAAVEVDVDAREGDPFRKVDGLSIESSTIELGPVGSRIPATVLQRMETDSGYRLLYAVPPSLKAGEHAIRVALDGGSASGDGAVFRGDRLSDLLVLLDRSQSMATLVGGTSRLDLARRAADAAAAALPDGAQLGLVAFAGNGSEPNDDATVALPLAPLDATHRTAFASALAALAPPSGPTSIGDALAAAVAQIEAGGAARQEHHAILLSDGAESEAASWPTVRSVVLASDLRVHAIALGANADQGLLAEIAAETGGTYEFVDESPAATLPTRLADAFARAADRADGRQRFFEAEQAVGVAPAIVPIAIGEAGLAALRVRIDWDDPAAVVSATLRDPNGTAVAHFNPKEFQFDDPVPGTWHLELAAAAGAPVVHVAGSGRFDGAYLVTSVSHRYGPQSVGRTGGFASQVPVAIEAALGAPSGPILGATGEATVEHPDGATEALVLRDDGEDADATPDDGVYTAVYRRTTAASATGASETVPGVRGSYRVKVRFPNVPSGAGTTQRIASESFWVGDGTPSDGDGDGLLDRYEANARCLAIGTADAGTDVDGDRRTNAQELAAGTDPCDSDTDHGGENDGSEVAHGADPGDPRDDALPAPGWLALVDKVAELHVPDDPRFVPQPLANLLRVPSAPQYESLVIERRLSGTAAPAPWAVLATVDPRALGGAYLDAGLPDGQAFDYRVRGVDGAGRESAVSRVLTATAKLDPLAPIGALRIEHGPRTDDVVLPVAIDLYGDDAPGDVEMRLASSGDGSPAWEPYQLHRVVPLATVAAPTMTQVAATLRDAAGNESLRYGASIMQYPPGSLGSIRGTAHRTDAGGDADLRVRIGVADPIHLTDADGAFVLDDLLPGTYIVELSDESGGATGRITGVVVDPGGETDVGTVLVPEAGGAASGAIALALLLLSRRRAGRDRAARRCACRPRRAARR